MFLLFALFVATVNGSSLANTLFNNPEAFAQGFESADNDVIRKVIGIMNDLITENEAAKDSAISAHSAAVKALTNADKLLKNATDDLTFKKGELEVYSKRLDVAVTLLKTRVAELDAAVKAKGNAEKAHTDAKIKKYSEIKRINKEKLVLEEVLKILDSLKNDNGRRLMSVDAQAFLANLAKQGLDVDPKALQEVRKAVGGLITAGEEIRDAVTEAEGTAATKLAEAKQKEEKAVAAKNTVSRQVNELKGKVKTYKASVAAATEVHETRKTEQKAADQAEKQTDKFRISEINRSKSENKNFNRVKTILEKFL